jgi:two-component system chemotaxis response regulator CheB
MVEAVVVEDSQFMRVQIRKILEKYGIDVVADVHNGPAAIDAVQEHDPDVVTMDVKMPGMDGIEAVEEIMATHPTPILMLSRFTDAESETTFEALAAGAVDFFPKPDSEATTELVQYSDDLVESVEVVAEADVSRISRPGETDDDVTEEQRITSDAATARDPDADLPVLVIAASTGGPPVVQSVMDSLPAKSGIRGLIVQHMPADFTGRYADRLDARSGFDVQEAGDFDRIGPGEFRVARGGTHLVATDDDGTTLELETTDDPPVHSVKPAADLTMESVANTATGPIVTTVLTGMGRDGAAGVEHVTAAGGTAIAQSPESASISSMPENAIETGTVAAVVPTEELPGKILEAID